MPRWFIWSLAALVSWGVWALLSKLIGDALSAAQSQALSTLGLLPVIAALSRTREGFGAFDQRRGMAAAFAAGMLSSLGNVAYYQALNMGVNAATVIPLTALYPLVTIALALAFLKESLNAVQIAGIALSLLAIYLLNVPNAGGILWPWLAVALIPIALWGAAGFLQKISTHHLSGEASTLWFLLAFVPVAILILLTQPWPASLSARTWLLAGALGLFFSLGNYALLAAFAQQGKASIITPLTALYPIVSVPAAILFFGEKVGIREWAGIGLALVSVAALSFEKRRALNCKAASSSPPLPAKHERGED